MSHTLQCFSSIEDLEPVFDHGGKIIFIPIMIHPGCCIVKGNGLPWEIVVRSLATRGLSGQKETIVHEFIHLFHASRNQYRPVAKEEAFLHEIATERATKSVIKRNPRIADEITKKLILHPNCSILFPSNDESNPFQDYYQRFFSEVTKQYIS